MDRRSSLDVAGRVAGVASSQIKCMLDFGVFNKGNVALVRKQHLMCVLYSLYLSTGSSNMEYLRMTSKSISIIHRPYPWHHSRSQY